MDLFKVENGVAKPTEHALLISPYKDMWDRDETPNKEQAIREFTFIELNCSFKKSNPFKGYPDGRREQEILKNIFKDEEITIDLKDELIVEGIELYEKLRKEASPTIQYYLASKEGAEKMIKWLREFDMNKENPRNGMPLYKPREITSALKDSYDVMKTLNSLEEKVYEQIFESAKTKSNKEINYFEE